MGRISGMVLAAAYGVAVGCGVAPTQPDSNAPRPAGSVVVTQDSAAIPFSGTVTFEAYGVSITYESLEGDSRCPRGVTCVWEGDAEVRVRVASADGSLVGTLHTTLEPRELVLGSVVVELVTVIPYPVEGVTVDPAQTTIVVRVSEDD